MTLSDLEIERYSRQLVLPEWSGEAQERLGSSSAVVVGLGALGSPVATYLVAAGVGTVGLVDDGVVELSNLHRQPLHYTPDLGIPKVTAAAVKLRALNPEVQVEEYQVRVEDANAEPIVAAASVVVDCSDSFETRYLVNDACCAQGVPLVSGAVLGFAGQAMTVVPGRSACYRCAFETPPAPGSVPSCREAGVLGATAAIVGGVQALEALKLLAGVGRPLIDRILQLDALSLEQTLVSTERRAGCPSCSRVPAAPQSV
jgi:molybdopterin/thiamine biosynthesis adenylyltransferase